MKITVINGSMRHGSTWNCTNLILNELSKYSEIKKTEFFLPKDMPEFCCGCFSCFLNGEATCPHAGHVAPLVRAITEADLVVLTSPVYGLDVTGQMKAFIDHLCFMWLSHRPSPSMFNTIGLTVTTTAGAGLRHTSKTMRNCLVFWGAKKIFTFKKAVAALKWSDVSEKKQESIRKEAAALAKKIHKTLKNIKRLPNPSLRSIMFKAMAGAMKKNNWNERDKDHWAAQGWLNGIKPF